MNQSGTTTSRPTVCPRCKESRHFLDPARGQLSVLHPRQVMNPLSRRDNATYICRVCGTAEFLMDFCKLNWEQARIAAETDRQEALRLPPGGFHGMTAHPTGGLTEHFALVALAYNAEEPEEETE